MYCPSCREKINDETVCPKCGEDVTAAQKMQGKKKRNIYGILIGDLIIIGISYFFINSIIWYVTFIILLGLATLTLYYGYVKNLGNLAPIGKCCYNCSNMYLNSNYCIECGTDLRNELGFSYYHSSLGNYELRIKEDSFRITKYNYAQGLRVNACSNNYPVEHMRNLRVSKYRRGFVRTPCIIFDFDPEEMHIYHPGPKKSNNIFKIPILKPLAPQIENAINDPIFEKARINDPYT